MKKRRIAIRTAGIIGLLTAGMLTADMLTAGMLTADLLFKNNIVMAAETEKPAAEIQTETLLENASEGDALTVYKKNEYKDVGCTMILPSGYQAISGRKGMYQAERHPLDSSNICYTETETLDREIIDKIMTSDDYKKRLETKFKEAYGTAAEVTAYQCEPITVDDCPGYKVELTCRWDNMEMNQLIYIITADQTYTITYSQASDDERMDDFKRSAETLHIVKSNS